MKHFLLTLARDSNEERRCMKRDAQGLLKLNSPLWFDIIIIIIITTALMKTTQTNIILSPTSWINFVKNKYILSK